MILLQTPSRFLLQTLLNRIRNLEKALEVDYHSVEFDDVRYHIQASAKDPRYMVLSISIPPPAPEVVFSGGLPFGAIEAVRGAYGAVVQIVDPPEDGFQLTIKIDLAKVPSDEENRIQLMTKIASLRAVVLGAPMREILKHLASKAVAPDADRLVALMHRPKESFFLIPQERSVGAIESEKLGLHPWHSDCYLAKTKVTVWDLLQDGNIASNDGDMEDHIADGISDLPPLDVDEGDPTSIADDEELEGDPTSIADDEELEEDIGFKP